MGRPARMHTDAQVMEARDRVRTGGTTVARLAREWRVDFASLNKAVSGRTRASLNNWSPPVVGPVGGAASILTKEVVANAREAAREGAAISSLAEEAGVSYKTMHAAIRGRTWAHVVEPPPVDYEASAESRFSRRLRTLLTESEVASARREYAAGRSISSLAEHHQVACSTIHAAIHGKSWAWVTDPVPIPTGRPGRPHVPPDADQTIAQARAAGATFREAGALVGLSASQACRRLQQMRASE